LKRQYSVGVAMFAFVCSLLLMVSPLSKAERLGFGRAVSAQEIQLWDIDVRPDGAGLPKGNGSVAEGKVLYLQQCLSCHGDRGLGGVNEPLAGRIAGDAFPFGRDPGLKKTIGNYWPYATTVFDYIRRAMPFSQPGTLSDDEVYSLVAYLLHLNDIIDPDQHIGADNLAAIRMPSRHRFVVDDRIPIDYRHPEGG
jgi:mono/diheme cytochrome c family protein